jgi:branched-chain amino acid transport system permease protein
MKRLALLLVVLALVPLFVTDRGALYFMTLVMIWCVFALGYDLVFGVTGLLSFGHAAFFGVGSYVFAFIVVKQAAPFLVAVVAAGLAGGLLALGVAAVALRLSGIYFSLMTLAIAELLFFVASSPMRALTGGEDGLTGVPRPTILGVAFYDDARYYLLVLVFLALALAASRMLRLSPFGQALNGVRVNEIRADQVGFNVTALKLGAFAISGVFSGVAGALLGSLMQFVHPQGLHWSTSGDVVIMTLLGGIGTLFGPVVGVVVFETLKEVISSYTVHWYGILGLIFIVATMFMPRGILGLLVSARDRWLVRRKATP